MSNQDIVNKIKTKGYWIINIHPSEYKEKLVTSRSTVKDVVRNAVVELRGWDYPHFSDRDGGPKIIDNGIEQSIDWENHIEFWRMTQSLNFLHILALREDWLDSIDYRNMWSRGDELKDKKILGVLGTLYTIVEIFEFSKRLIRQDLFTGKVLINIQLHDVNDRQLYVDSYNRVPFSFDRKSSSTKPWVWEKEYELTDIANNAEALSLEAFLDLIDLFGWTNPPLDAYKSDITKFLEGKI